MAPKRARTAAAARASASSSPQAADDAALKLTLHGGVPHHPALAGLWRDERLTDFALSAEGVEFKAHASAAVGGKLYVFGGYGFGRLSTAEVYDPASDSWAPVTSLTSGRQAMAAIAL